MARRALVFAGLCAAALAGAAPAQDPPAGPEGGGIKISDRDPAFLTRCNAAVAKGRTWLESRSKADGQIHDPLGNGAGHGPYPHGPTAIAVLTLLHAGGTPFDPPVEKGFAFLKEKWDAWVASGKQLQTATSWKTYEVGLTLMALEAKARWRPPSLRGKHDTGVVGGMKLAVPEGEWAKQLKDFLVETAISRTKTVKGKTGNSGQETVSDAWSYPASPSGDHSNTQYAILGLKAASRLAVATKRTDLRPPYALWIAVLAHFIEIQENTGPSVKRVDLDKKALKEGYIVTTTSTTSDRARGWAYNVGMPPSFSSTDPYQAATGSMTCVGLASVELAWSEIESAARGDFGWPGVAKDAARLAIREKHDLYEKSINDGFAWMAENFAVDKNPNHNGWHYYYLYGLERAGVLADRAMIGKHDWYREGAEVLLSQQGGDGSWTTAGDGHEVATCFALLFLTKATVPVKGTVTGGGH